jgi:hypothetical protein
VLYCAEVLAPATGDTSAARVLLIRERVEGFFIERLSGAGDALGATQHETLDEAMEYANSKLGPISDWRFCPPDVDPLVYLQRHADA